MGLEAGHPATSDEPYVSLQRDCQNLCDEFPDLFKLELGCLTDFELEVKFKADAVPIFHKARSVPFALRDDLVKGYEEDIAKGVWKPVQFNEYGTPVVPIRKAHTPGSLKPRLWICGDYSVGINDQLEDHRHPLPLPEELMQKLGDGFVYTKIDLADAYNQIQLAQESQRRLALSTHRGVLLQQRLPFEKGLIFRLDKCQFAQPSVEYLGHTLSAEGISKGSKVKAVLKIPPPTDVSSLKSFQGSVQFYGKFIPNLASMAKPLYRLKKKETPWKWEDEEQATFEHLKNVLSSDQVLVHFDPNKTLVLACDTSNIGIGGERASSCQHVQDSHCCRKKLQSNPQGSTVHHIWPKEVLPVRVRTSVYTGD